MASPTHSMKASFIFQMTWDSLRKWIGGDPNRWGRRMPPPGMILRNHTYLKVYKCWWILPILKIPTIKCLAIFFKKYFNFQRFYIVYIINWQFLGWKTFTPSKLGETGLQKLQNGESFFRENPLKISHGINFAPKIIPVHVQANTGNHVTVVMNT